MTEKELPGVSKNTFKLVLDKNFKSESYSLCIVTKPKNNLDLNV